MNKEIELNLLSVNVAVVIHNHGFQTAALHVGNDLQNAHFPHLYLPICSKYSATLILAKS